MAQGLSIDTAESELATKYAVFVCYVCDAARVWEGLVAVFDEGKRRRGCVLSGTHRIGWEGRESRAHL